MPRYATLAAKAVLLLQLVSYLNPLHSAQAAPLALATLKSISHDSIQLHRTMSAALSSAREKEREPRESPIECDICEGVVAVAQDLFESNKTEDEVAEFITNVCIVLKIEDRNVCSLVIPEFKVCVRMQTRKLIIISSTTIIIIHCTEYK